MAPILIRPFSLRAPSGARLHGLLTRPLGRRRLPAVVLVPGATGAGRTMAARAASRRLAASGVVVVSFNAEGRSSGRIWDRRSGGRPDLNGPRDQDGLAEVIRFAARHHTVDPDFIGIYTISFGLVAAAGAIARHPGLPVRFILDEEGPTDCFAASLQAWALATGPGSGSGSGWPERALALLGHACPSPGDTSGAAAFWAVREPIRSIPHFRGCYLRLQAERDHVQPPRAPGFHAPPRWWHNKHAVTLINAAVAGGVPWSRINTARFGNPVGATYTTDRPPRYVPGALADHPGLWVEAVEELIQACGSRSPGR